MMKQPTPADVKSARLATGLTQKQAAAVIYENIRSWQRYEEGSREMSCALYELFLLKTGQIEVTKMKYIYADMINGNALIEADDINGIEIDVCKDMTDVRMYLKDMGLNEGEIFERVLQVPNYLVEIINEEYGVRE